MEDSPESLEVGEISRGRLHKGARTATQRLLDSDVGLLDVGETSL